MQRKSRLDSGSPIRSPLSHSVMATEPENAAPTDFRVVYDEHFDFVWRSLRRLGIHPADVADATQEVFLVVHRRLAEFEGRARITTWLYRICLRVASDRRRRARRRREESSDMESLDQTDLGQSSEDRMVEDEDLRLLEAALMSLSLEQRAVFTLFELEKMTCESIASVLEIPLGTVYSRLRLGRDAFRKALLREFARQRSNPVPCHNGTASPVASGGRPNHD
jgi:RNA polymerase sigma-70 factor, ECF subfamily